MRTRLPRPVHPLAWWGWALGLAVALSQTTNPILLLLGIGVASLVVVSRRGDSPWARAFRLYVWLGVAIVVMRAVLHVLIGVKVGTKPVLPLPSLDLPSWAAGIQLGGTVYLEGLLLAIVLGLRLAAMIVAIGAANALANPKRMLKSLPSGLQELGTAVVVAISVAPQLAQSVQRVVRARELRGTHAPGLRSVRQVALPVLQDTLDRSLALAAAMDARGYGRRVSDDPRTHRIAALASLGSLLGTALGLYAILSADLPTGVGVAILAAGIALALLALRVGGAGIQRSTYRPDPWRGPEWLTLSSGLAAAAALLVVGRTSPAELILPVDPLTWPALPPLAVAGLAVAALPAFLTPEPPAARRSGASGVSRARAAQGEGAR